MGGGQQSKCAWLNYTNAIQTHFRKSSIYTPSLRLWVAAVRGIQHDDDYDDDDDLLLRLTKTN